MKHAITFLGDKKWKMASYLCYMGEYRWILEAV